MVYALIDFVSRFAFLMSGVYVFGVYDTYFAIFNFVLFEKRCNVSKVFSELQYTRYIGGQSQ